MTREDKKKKLADYHMIEERIETLSDQYAVKFCAATKIVPGEQTDGSRSATLDSKQERQVGKLVELRTKLEKEVKKKLLIDAELAKLNLYQAALVRDIDINGMSIKRASAKYKRNYKYIINLHNELLDKMVF